MLGGTNELFENGHVYIAQPPLALSRLGRGLAGLDLPADRQPCREPAVQEPNAKQRNRLHGCGKGDS